MSKVNSETMSRAGFHAASVAFAFASTTRQHCLVGSRQLPFPFNRSTARKAACGPRWPWVGSQSSSTLTVGKASSSFTCSKSSVLFS